MTRFAVAFIYALFTFSAAWGQCPEGMIYSPTFKKCYFFQLNSLDQPTAQRACANKGGRLVAVMSAFEQAFLTEKSAKTGITSNYWIGLNSIANFQRWEWENGTGLSYNNWDYGCPSADMQARCVVESVSNGKWRNIACTDKLKAACELSASVNISTALPPTISCSDGWSYLKTTKLCYKVLDKGFTLEEAKTCCNELGANLASIHSQEENNFIYEMSRTNGTGMTPQGLPWARIGYFAPDSQLNFQTVDGSPFDYFNWAMWPSHSWETSAFIYTSGYDKSTWYTAMQQVIIKYAVCKKNPPVSD